MRDFFRKGLRPTRAPIVRARSCRAGTAALLRPGPITLQRGQRTKLSECFQPASFRRGIDDHEPIGHWRDFISLGGDIERARQSQSLGVPGLEDFGCDRAHVITMYLRDAGVK